MSRHELGEAIAQRVLTVETDGASAEEITVSLGKPCADGRDFYCAYEIKGAGREKVMRIYGVDGFQAILLAVETLRLEIQLLNEELGGKLKWTAGSPDDFNIPPPAQL